MKCPCGEKLIETDVTAQFGGHDGKTVVTKLSCPKCHSQSTTDELVTAKAGMTEPISKASPLWQ